MATRIRTLSIRGLKLLLAALIVAGALHYLPILGVTGRTYYVSRLGNNADGLSWATAWNELSRINWSVVQPGDTILIDGGTYASTLTIGKSGQAGAPIRIQAAGPVVIFGGRTTPLPECDQASYTFQTAGVRSFGIDFGSAAYVIVDGMGWRGISIYGHNSGGINLDVASASDTVRNVEIYDNGTAWLTSAGLWRPDQPGARPRGSGHLFERDIIHDNGQDAFQTGQALNNFTVRESWLYNTRGHSTQRYSDGSGPAPFNYCMHSDGLQIYNGGTMSGFLFERDVMGPGLLQGLLLGQSGAGGSAVVNNVTIRNTLFYAADNASIMGYAGTASLAWTIEHVTSVRPSVAGACTGAERWHNVLLEGSGHRITDSILVGGCGVTMPSDTVFARNANWGLDQNVPSALSADPLFVDPSNSSKVDRDFALKAGSPAAGLGSAITSARMLLALGVTSSGTATAAPTGTPGSAATSTSTPAAATQPAATVTATQLATSAPTGAPTTQPTAQPTTNPTVEPTTQPTAQPTAPANTVSLTFNPVADVYVDAANPTAQYGAAEDLRTGASPEQVSYLRFSVQGVSGRRVTRVLLKLYTNSGSNDGFRVQQVSDNTWPEMSTNYDNRPALGALIVASGSHGAHYVTVDITGYVTGDGTYSLALTSTSTKSLRYRSREASANPPQLIVNAGP